MSAARIAQKDIVRIEEAAEMLKAVAHPVRLRIVALLESGERTVTELYEALETPQAYTSQLLLAMKARGILTSQRVGNQVFYRIARPEVLDIIRCVRCRESDCGTRRRRR